MASSSNRRLACLIAIIATVGPNASAETKPANRRAIAQVGNAVIIRQPDRFVIVQGGMRAAIHTRTLDGNGKSMSFEVTIDADNGQDGAIVRIEDRKISCDGDASIELIPRRLNLAL